LPGRLRGQPGQHAGFGACMAGGGDSLHARLGQQVHLIDQAGLAPCRLRQRSHVGPHQFSLLLLQAFLQLKGECEFTGDEGGGAVLRWRHVISVSDSSGP
jgi:hypothetical protein